VVRGLRALPGGDGDRPDVEPHERLDDRALAERAAHDVDAFGELYRRHVNAIHAFAWRRSGSRDIAEDVTAATFERAWASMGAFRWRDGGFVAWLHRIASNELVEVHRRSERAERAVRRLTPVPDEPELDLLADWPRVRVALGDLRPRYQEAITLRYLSGLSADDAAAALGCSKPVLAVTLHRALKALAKAVER
jgi:RNA polymerase sigma-70 factor (ECF subfamily)